MTTTTARFRVPSALLLLVLGALGLCVTCEARAGTAASTVGLGPVAPITKLTYTSGTVVPALTSSSAASWLTVGNAAGNLVQLDGSGLVPTAVLPAGSGGIGGSTGAADNRVLRSDGTAGATAQASALICDDSGNLSGVGNITLSGTVDGVDVSALSASLGTASTHAATDFEAADATLAALAGGTCAADTLLYCSGSDTVASATITSTARSLLDDTSTSAMRTTLGLGTAATAAATDFQAAGVGTWPADSWDYEWATADGDPLTHSWAHGSARAVTTALVTTGICATTNCYSLTPSGTSGTSFIKYTATAATGSWEMRLKIGTATSSAVNLGFGYNPGATASGTKLPFWGLQTTGLAWWNGSMSIMGAYGSFVGQLIDVTIRCYNSGGGASYNWMETWIGPVLVDSRVGTSSWQSQTSAGDIILGRLAATADGNVIYIASVKLKWSGINSAPPSYTFRGQTYPL